MIELLRAVDLRLAGPVALLASLMALWLAAPPRSRWDSAQDLRLTYLHGQLTSCTAQFDAIEYDQADADLLTPTEAPWSSTASELKAPGPTVDQLERIASRLDLIAAQLGVGAAQLFSKIPNLGLDQPDPVDLYFSSKHHQSIATDPYASDASRVRSLRALDSIGHSMMIDEQLTDQMLELARRSSSEQIRREVLWGLSKRPFEQIKSTATDFLLFDKSRIVREEALDSLARFARSDSDARMLIERARDVDPSPRVRGRAGRLLRSMQ